MALLLAARGAQAGEMPSAVASVDSVRVLEGDADTTDATFTVRLSQAPSAATSLDFATADLGAVAGSDYGAVAGTLALDDSTLVYSIRVPIYGDRIVEGNESFVLRLSNPGPGVTLGDSIGIGTIVNDERARFLYATAGLTPYPVGSLGPAFADANLDVFPDLPLDDNGGLDSFRPMAGMAAALRWGNHHGCAWCDYDRDGDPDLVITPYAETDSLSKLQLLRNLGNGVYEDVAPALGMDVSGDAETPVWGDFDGDGWPDLFVPYYAHVPPGRSFLWRNNHDGTFSEIATEAGVDLAGLPEELKPEGADAVDWNGDGSLDLYCAQRLFLNDGTGHFHDVSESVGLPQLFDEGARFVDVDGDGDFDLYLRTWTGPRLFRNDDGAFTEITAAAGLPERPLSWGDSWADVDDDGDLDLLLMNFDAPAELYLNQGDGTFVADTAFAAQAFPSGLSAWADVDLDGDLDAAVGASDRGVLLNQLDELDGASSSCLRVWVLDEDSLLDCPGAVARLRRLDGGPGSVMTRRVDGGSGYLKQNEYPLHFGGIGPGRYSLEVRYPGSDSSATVVDGSVAPLLADFSPESLGMAYLFVFRDGRVSWRPAGPRNPLAVTGPAPAPGMRLGRPWPSPARSRVSFGVRGQGEAVDLDVFDLAGRRVRSLVRGLVVPGTGNASWDLRDDSGRAVPSGIYFLRLRAGVAPAEVRRILVAR